MTDPTTMNPGNPDECATHVEDARAWLAAVLVGPGGRDSPTALVVGEALSVLSEVTPPLPPLHYPDVGVTAAVGVERALEALARAGSMADGVADAARFAHAARILARYSVDRA